MPAKADVRPRLWIYGFTLWIVPHNAVRRPVLQAAYRLLDFAKPDRFVLV
jgi:hypothetical protein